MTLNQKDLDVALAGVTKLAGGLEKAYALIGALSDRLELYRAESMVLLKVVAGILARECRASPNPQAHLDELLVSYFKSAEAFDLISGSEPKEANESKFIAACHRDIASALRAEAVRVLTGSPRGPRRC